MMKFSSSRIIQIIRASGQQVQVPRRPYSGGLSDVDKEIHIYASKKQTGVSLKSLLETGRGELLNKFPIEHHTIEGDKKSTEKILMQVACFLHHELPVRFAHRVSRLESSPVLSQSVSINRVSNLYKSSFAKLRACPIPNDLDKEKQFAAALDTLFQAHSSTLILMAKGAHEVRGLLKHDISKFSDDSDTQKRLDDFYMSRIGIQILIGQYLALRNKGRAMGGTPEDLIGLISQHASPRDIALQTISDAAHICTRTHGDAPEVTIHGRTDLTFPYITSHLHYIMLELLKNSMRATVERHGTDNMPPIRIVIADGEDNEDVVIKISDEGGGICRSNVKRIWSYLYTTADSSVLEGMLVNDEATDATPLAGLGYGLPIARNYARCFGGDMTLMSMEGYGTDSYIYLPRLGALDNSVV